MIIGLEGVSCTGKTTLARGLADRLADTVVVPCYYHAAPDPSVIPAPQVASETDQLHALAVHLDIEDLRRHSVQQAVAGGRRVVLDRTVDTLLAHLRAVGLMNGLDAYATARPLVERHIAEGRAVVPDVTLLLHAEHELVAARARARTGMLPLYYDPVFTDGFHTHFRDPITPVCLPLNAGPPAEQVLDQACRLLEPFLDGSP